MTRLGGRKSADEDPESAAADKTGGGGGLTPDGDSGLAAAVASKAAPPSAGGGRGCEVLVEVCKPPNSDPSPEPKACLPGCCKGSAVGGQPTPLASVEPETATPAGGMTGGGGGAAAATEAVCIATRAGAGGAGGEGGAGGAGGVVGDAAAAAPPAASDAWPGRTAFRVFLTGAVPAASKGMDAS